MQVCIMVCHVLVRTLGDFFGKVLAHRVKLPQIEVTLPESIILAPGDQ